jgi:hypothetical protein
MRRTNDLNRNPDQAFDLKLPKQRDTRSTKVSMVSMGLHIPRDISFEDWEHIGKQLSKVVDSSSWWLGDWLVFGKKYYSDRYQRAIRSAGLSYQTLRNYAWVARRFELHRRREHLTFQHHAEVASLPLELQDSLLDGAERHHWTTKQLRKEIQALHNAAGGECPAPDNANSQIEVPNSRLFFWRRAADALGVEFEHWVRTILDRAAKEILKEQQQKP